MATARRRPPPSAIVNPKHASGIPFETPPAPGIPQQASPQLAALQGGAVDPSAFVADPMSAMLLQRAERQEPIRGPVSLLGRLAALGVGQSLERKNSEARMSAVMGMIDELPKDKQLMARLVVMSGGDLGGALLTHRGQDITAKGITADVAVRREGLSLEAQKLELDWKNAVANREQQAAQFAQTLGVEYSGLAIDAAQQALAEKNSTLDENYRRDALAQETDFKTAELLARGLDLNTDQRKALGHVAAYATPFETMAKDFVGYVPTKLTDQLMATVATLGSDSLSSTIKQYIKSSAYEDMDDDEKRFFTTAISIAETATRRASGSTVTGADIALTFARLIPRAGDTEEILDDKSEQRAAELDAMLVGLPESAVKELIAAQKKRKAKRKK